MNAPSYTHMPYCVNTMRKTGTSNDIGYPFTTFRETILGVGRESLIALKAYYIEQSVLLKTMTLQLNQEPPINDMQKADIVNIATTEMWTAAAPPNQGAIGAIMPRILSVMFNQPGADNEINDLVQQAWLDSQFNEIFREQELDVETHYPRHATDQREMRESLLPLVKKLVYDIYVNCCLQDSIDILDEKEGNTGHLYPNRLVDLTASCIRTGKATRRIEWWLLRYLALGVAPQTRLQHPMSMQLCNSRNKTEFRYWYEIPDQNQQNQPPNNRHNIHGADGYNFLKAFDPNAVLQNFFVTEVKLMVHHVFSALSKKLVRINELIGASAVGADPGSGYDISPGQYNAFEPVLKKFICDKWSVEHNLLDPVVLHGMTWAELRNPNLIAFLNLSMGDMISRKINTDNLKRPSLTIKRDHTGKGVGTKMKDHISLSKDVANLGRETRQRKENWENEMITMMQDLAIDYPTLNLYYSLIIWLEGYWQDLGGGNAHIRKLNITREVYRREIVRGVEVRRVGDMISVVAEKAKNEKLHLKTGTQCGGVNHSCSAQCSSAKFMKESLQILSGVNMHALGKKKSQKQSKKQTALLKEHLIQESRQGNKSKAVKEVAESYSDDCNLNFFWDKLKEVLPFEQIEELKNVITPQLLFTMGQKCVNKGPNNYFNYNIVEPNQYIVANRAHTTLLLVLQILRQLKEDPRQYFPAGERERLTRNARIACDLLEFQIPLNLWRACSYCQTVSHAKHPKLCPAMNLILGGTKTGQLFNVVKYVAKLANFFLRKGLPICKDSSYYGTLFAPYIEDLNNRPAGPVNNQQLSSKMKDCLTALLQQPTSAAPFAPAFSHCGLIVRFVQAEEEATIEILNQQLQQHLSSKRMDHGQLAIRNDGAANETKEEQINSFMIRHTEGANSNQVEKLSHFEKNQSMLSILQRNREERKAAAANAQVHGGLKGRKVVLKRVNKNSTSNNHHNKAVTMLGKREYLPAQELSALKITDGLNFNIVDADTSYEVQTSGFYLLLGFIKEEDESKNKRIWKAGISKNIKERIKRIRSSMRIQFVLKKVVEIQSVDNRRIFEKQYFSILNQQKEVNRDLQYLDTKGSGETECFETSSDMTPQLVLNATIKHFSLGQDNQKRPRYDEPQPSLDSVAHAELRSFCSTSPNVIPLGHLLLPDQQKNPESKQEKITKKDTLLVGSSDETKSNSNQKPSIAQLYHAEVISNNKMKERKKMQSSLVEINSLSEVSFNNTPGLEFQEAVQEDQLNEKRIQILQPWQAESDENKSLSYSDEYQFGFENPFDHLDD